MKFSRTIAFPLSLVGACSLAASTPQVKSEHGRSQVIRSAGEFLSPKGTCRVALKTSELGGFLVLNLGKSANRTVDDVEGMAWVSK